MSQPKRSKKYKTIDLFCGIGGIRKGFELTNGFKNVLSAENGKDSFSFPKIVSDTQQYKQLGNSVSIPVIEELAKYMYKRLEESIIGFNFQNKKIFVGVHN